jgi:DNA-binding SARP family transcriptional activator
MLFSLLGPVEARDGAGRSLDLGSRRQRALLAMLLLDADRVVGLDALIAGLWGDAAPAKAAASVQSYVSNLRRALEPDRAPRAPARVLVSRGTGYLLHVGPGDLDVGCFEAAVDEADEVAASDPAAALTHLDRALAMWRGPALAEFTTEPFAAAEAGRLEELRMSTEEARIDALLRAGDVDAAAADAGRLVERAPLRERRQRQLMTALYRAGRQADALESHRRYVDRLADEFGLDPSPDLDRLHADILRHEVTASAPPVTAPTVGSGAAVRPTVGSGAADAPTVRSAAAEPRTAQTLVGREAELHRVDHALEAAFAGHGRVVLLAGEPGIGKTRTLEETLTRARRRGMVTALGRCFEGGGAPAFWPFVEIGRALAEQATAPAEADAVDRLLASVRPATADHLEADAEVANVVDPATRFLAAGRIADALTALARSRPTVVAVDDAYGADPDSLDALVRVAADAADAALVLLITVRTTDLPVGHPLTAMLGELSRLPHLSRIVLGGLDLAETRDLVRATSGRDVDAWTVSRIHRRTEGNPFFAVEVARLLDASDAALERQVPAGVRDVVRLRLAGLPAVTQDVLRLAATYGRTFPRDVIATVLDRSELSVLDDLEPAVAAQLVEDGTSPASHRFSHVLVQQAIAEGVSAARRARDHAAIVQVLITQAEARPELWVEVAHHAVEAVPAAGIAAAVDPLSRAALHAVSVNAHELAQQLIERRIDLLIQDVPGHDRDVAELQAQLDLCVVLPITTGWHATSLEQASRRVIELGRRTGDDDAVTRALSASSANSTVRGDYGHSLEIAGAQREIHLRTREPAHAFLTHHGAAMAHLFRGELQRSGEVYAAADALVPVLDPDEDGRFRIPPDRMAATAHHASLWALQLWLTGDVLGSRRQRDRARAIALRAGHLQTVWTVTLSHVIGAYQAGDPRGVLDGDRWRRAEAGDLRSPLVEDLIGVPVAWASVATGDATSLPTLRTRIDELTDRGALVFGALYRAALADAYLRVDRVEDAGAALDEAAALAERTGERWWDAGIEQLRAVVHHRLGQSRQAALALTRARSIAATQGAVTLLERAEATAADIGANATA